MTYAHPLRKLCFEGCESMLPVDTKASLDSMSQTFVTEVKSPPKIPRLRMMSAGANKSLSRKVIASFFTARCSPELQDFDEKAHSQNLLTERRSLRLSNLSLTEKSFQEQIEETASQIKDLRLSLSSLLVSKNMVVITVTHRTEVRCENSQILKVPCGNKKGPCVVEFFYPL